MYVMCVRAVYVDECLSISVGMYVCVYMFLFSVCVLGAPVLKRNFAHFCILTSFRPFTFQFILIKFMLGININSYIGHFSS